MPSVLLWCCFHSPAALYMEQVWNSNINTIYEMNSQHIGLRSGLLAWKVALSLWILGVWEVICVAMSNSPKHTNQESSKTHYSRFDTVGHCRVDSVQRSLAHPLDETHVTDNPVAWAIIVRWVYWVIRLIKHAVICQHIKHWQIIPQIVVWLALTKQHYNDICTTPAAVFQH
jgi:hypothetical protein